MDLMKRNKQSTTILESKISEYYDHWRSCAVNICKGNQDKADDLLHHSLSVVMDAPTFNELLSTDQIKAYVIGFMKLEYTRQNSTFNRNYKIADISPTKESSQQSGLSDAELDTVLSSLDFFEREVLTLNIKLGMTATDIARETGISHDRIKTTLRTTKQSIRKWLVG